MTQSAVLSNDPKFTLIGAASWARTCIEPPRSVDRRHRAVDPGNAGIIGERSVPPGRAIQARPPCAGAGVDDPRSRFALLKFPGSADTLPALCQRPGIEPAAGSLRRS